MNKNGVCRLCLEVILDNDFKRLDDVTRKMLQCIPLTLDVSITKDPVVCSTCVQSLQMLFEFKMSCLSNNDYLKTYVSSYNSVKLNLEKLLGRNVISSALGKEENICRFCLGYFDRNFFVELNNVEQDMFLKDMFDKCLSEIDLNITENPLMCKDCMELLENQFNFMMSCLDNEAKINYFFSAGKRNNLNDILERMKSLENESDIGVISEYSRIVVDDSINNIEDEKPEGIQDGIFYVKIDNANQEYKDPVSESVSFDNVNEVKKLPSTENLVTMYNCSLCTFQTKTKSYLRKHSILHEDPLKVLLHKCDKCDYATKWKGDLRKHYLKHHSSSVAVTIYKCHLCSYVAKSWSSLEKHSRRHICQTSLAKYKCKECSFETPEKFILKRHYKFKHNKDIEFDILSSKLNVSN